MEFVVAVVFFGHLATAESQSDGLNLLFPSMNVDGSALHQYAANASAHGGVCAPSSKVLPRRQLKIALAVSPPPREDLLPLRSA